jgi:uncharacterized protein (DUF1684 family)
MRLRLLLALAALPAALLSCNRPPTPDPSYAEEITQFRARRVASLTKEDGWLSLIALAWLKPGENVFGSDPAGALVLPVPGIPARAGSFVLGADGTVVVKSEPGAPVAVNGAPATGAPLAADRTGKPDLVTVGRLRLTLIQRADQLAIRVRDPESLARTGFKGIDSFPVDPRLRLKGTFEPFASLREVEVPSAHGPAQKMFAAGVVRFRLGEKDLSLEPFVDGPDDDTFFFVFRDRTAGTETYGGGRFLNSPAPKAPSREVTLDFNRATSPPCAFSPYATCPLPLPQNDLAVRVEAGEKVPARH